MFEGLNKIGKLWCQKGGEVGFQVRSGISIRGMVPQVQLWARYFTNVKYYLLQQEPSLKLVDAYTMGAIPLPQINTSLQDDRNIRNRSLGCTVWI